MVNRYCAFFGGRYEVAVVRLGVSLEVIVFDEAKATRFEVILFEEAKTVLLVASLLVEVVVEHPVANRTKTTGRIAFVQFFIET
jgi:hypothetical protein